MADTAVSTSVAPSASAPASAPSAATPSVLITGFGPFGHHKVNPSWELVKTLGRELRLPGRAPVPLEVARLPVEYDAVARLVPLLWDSHPGAQMAIHCGVGSPGRLCMETRANRTHYERLDICGLMPPNNACCADGPECYSTQVDVERAMGVYHACGGSEGSLTISTDAGHYLCEFSFYQSMHCGRGPVVFVHVPPVNQPFPFEQLQELYHKLISAIVEVTLGSSIPAAIAPAVAASVARPKVGLAVFIRCPSRPGCILLGKRISAHSDGNVNGKDTFAPPGGHLEMHESFEECAAREVLEETGLTIHNIRYGTVANATVRELQYHYVTVFMVADSENGCEAVNAEPHKCEGWGWYEWASPDFPTRLFTALEVVRSQGFDPIAF